MDPHGRATFFNSQTMEKLRVSSDLAHMTDRATTRRLYSLRLDLSLTVNKVLAAVLRNEKLAVTNRILRQVPALISCLAVRNLKVLAKVK